jgi:hypothetical protein
LKKKTVKKLSLNKETLAKLEQVVGGYVQQDDVFTDTDGDTFASGGPAICWISDCNPCETQYC